MSNSFYQQIDNLTIETSQKTTDFYEFICNMRGVHPIEIIHSLNRVYNNGNIGLNVYDQIILSAKSKRLNEKDDSHNRLPVPHMVDYDWRFSKQGISTFTGKIDSIITTTNVKSVVFIGSPSLFKYYCNCEFGNIQFYLIDFNANQHIRKSELLDNQHVIDCNIHYEFPVGISLDSIKADIIVMDPPWYPEYYERFFEISRKISRIGSVVLGVYPPDMTRSTVVTEKQRLSDFIRKLGFGDLIFEPHCIEYSTPPFEKNVLKANLINNYPANWRLGDLMVTTFIANTCEQVAEECFFTSNCGWSEKRSGIVRIKFKQCASTSNDLFNISISHLYNEDIYPSVSRRYNGCKSINVWTSGNRVFNCSNVPLLIRILEGLNDFDIINSLQNEYETSFFSQQKKDIIEVQKFLKEIVTMETQEYGSWS